MVDQEILDAASREVDEMEDEHRGSSAPFDYLDVARSVDESLERDPTAGRLDPAEPEHWRAVAAELRRRSGTPAS